MIGLRVRPGTARLVGRTLAAMGCVAYVGYTSGRYDLFTEAMLESNQALQVFLHESLGGIDGILSTEAFHVLEIEKFNYMWDLPEVEDPAGSRPKADRQDKRGRAPAKGRRQTETESRPAAHGAA
jgi:Lrp/AsnC family transcriptional regulator for asnA, asnC and gidA